MDIKERMAQVAQQDSGIGIILGSVPVAKVQDISLDKLHGYARHTFQLRKDTEHYNAMTESIRDSGIQTPLLVRPGQVPGEYEIIAGHTRYSIARELGLKTVPCIVKAMSDPEATRLMVESNLQRTEWLPSERARSYKAWLEAVREETGIKERQRTDLSAPTGSAQTRRTDDIAAERLGLSGDTLRLYIKLADLASPLLDLVDEGRIQVKAGYQLAFLDAAAQRVTYNVFAPGKGVIKEDTARALRVWAEQQGRLTPNDVREILRGGPALESKTMVRSVSFAVRLPSAVSVAAAKQLKKDEKFQAALETWIADYLRKAGQVGKGEKGD